MASPRELGVYGIASKQLMPTMHATVRLDEKRWEKLVQFCRNTPACKAQFVWVFPPPDPSLSGQDFGTLAQIAGETTDPDGVHVVRVVGVGRVELQQSTVQLQDDGFVTVQTTEAIDFAFDTKGGFFAFEQAQQTIQPFLQSQFVVRSQQWHKLQESLGTDNLDELSPSQLSWFIARLLDLSPEQQSSLVRDFSVHTRLLRVTSFFLENPPVPGWIGKKVQTKTLREEVMREICESLPVHLPAIAAAGSAFLLDELLEFMSENRLFTLWHLRALSVSALAGDVTSLDLHAKTTDSQFVHRLVNSEWAVPLSRFENLTELDLSCRSLVKANDIKSILTSVRKLQVLKLDRCHAANDDALSPLWTSQPLCSSLRVVQFAETNVTDKAIVEIAKHNSLECVSVSGYAITDVAFDTLTALSTIYDFKGDAIEITSSSLEKLVASWPKLESLQLPMCSQITKWNALAALSSSSTLKTLNLALNFEIGDDCVVSICNIKSLTSLDLSATKITDQGAKPLANLTNLQILNLGRTKLTDVGFISQLSHLETLAIPFCPVTKTLVHQLPQKIRNIDCKRCELIDDESLSILASRKLRINALCVGGTAITDKCEQALQLLAKDGLTRLSIWDSQLSPKCIEKVLNGTTLILENKLSAVKGTFLILERSVEGRVNSWYN